MDEKSNNGIYYIRNIITGQLYIGQTSRLDERESEHFSKLRRNCHFNNHLQNSYNKYGEDAFEFKIIERCSPECLGKYEKAYVDMYNLKRYGFNICDGGINVCPDNSNEKHGMWRKDIPNDNIKEMYLGEYSVAQIAEYYDCSRRTIERRLKKIFTNEELIALKKEKQLTGKCNFKLEFLPHDEVKQLYLAGYSIKELSEKYHCRDSIISKSLKSSLGDNYFKIKESLFPKKKSVKTKKRVPINIDLDELVSLYKQGWSSLKLADKYNCSKKTILQKLRDRLKDDYESVKQESFNNRQTVSDEDILKLVNEGYTSVEIASKLNSTRGIVMERLRKLYSPEQFENYKSFNRSCKMSEIYKNHHTEESKLKRISKMRKYSLWNGSHVHYVPNSNNTDWNSTFYARFNAKDVKTGKFIDFVSPQIVHDLIVDFS